MKARLVLLLLPLLLGAGTPEAPTWTGVIKAKGSAPFTFLALVDDQGHQWRLQGDLAELWGRAQGRRVVLTGQPSGKDAILVSSWAWAPEETKSDR